LSWWRKCQRKSGGSRWRLCLTQCSLCSTSSSAACVAPPPVCSTSSSVRGANG
jgi:hypothetical protein